MAETLTVVIQCEGGNGEEAQGEQPREAHLWVWELHKVRRPRLLKRGRIDLMLLDFRG